MKKLVVESLEELFESKKAEAAVEEKVKKEDKPKPENIKKVHAKVEKTKATKLKKEPKEDKYNQAIKALKDDLAKAKKPGAFKTTLLKNAKIKELQGKIDAWEKKLKDFKAKK